MRAMSQAPAPVFRQAVRVYWEDTDAGGIVFYANYLKFFERARTEWLRSLGVQQQALRDSTGTIFIVTDTALRYRQPARLDDQLAITVAVDEWRPASMKLSQQARRGDEQRPEARVSTAPCSGVIATIAAPLFCSGAEARWYGSAYAGVVTAEPGVTRKFKPVLGKYALAACS